MMPRKPCIICRTTISTPAKFLLQCSCGIGLHHNCIVPAMPKKTLMSMIEASTNDCHTNSLKTWQCPGCKVDDNTIQDLPLVKKKKSRLNAQKGSSLASSSRLRLDQMPKDAPLKQQAQRAADRHLMVPIPVNKVSKRTHKEDKLPASTHNQPLSLINPHHKPHNHLASSKSEKYSFAERIKSAAKEDYQAGRPPPKVLRTNDNHLEVRPVSAPALKDKGATNHPQLKGAPMSVRTVAPFIAQKSLKLPVAEKDIIPMTNLPSEKTRQSPPPPLLDLRKFLKRKRCDSHNIFQKKLHFNHDNVPIYEPVEPTVKKRRLDSYEPETRGASHPQSQALSQSKKKDSIVDPLTLVERNATSIQPLFQPTEKPPPTARRHTPNPYPVLQYSSTELSIAEMGQTAKRDCPEDIQIHNTKSNSESTCLGNLEPSNVNSSSNTLTRPSEGSSPGIVVANRGRSAEDLLNAPRPKGSTVERAASAIDDSEQIESSTPVREVSLVKEHTVDGITEAVHHERLMSDTASGALQRLEADRSRNSNEVGHDIQKDESSVISSSNSNCDVSKRTQETSFVDGLLSPPLTDPDNDNGHVYLGDDNRVRASDAAGRGYIDKMSITERSHSGNSTIETDLDIIAQQLPRPRPSFKLPRVTLPVLAQYFKPFRNSMKNADVAL